MIDLYDPKSYEHAPPHAEFERLRREDPVHYQPMPDGTGYWAVLRYADVVEVARHPKLFSAEVGGVVLEDLPPETLTMMRDMLLAMDPPRHLDHRRNIAPRFTPAVIASMEHRVREICRSILAGARAGVGGAVEVEFEFVHDVCAHVPSQVVGELVGIPREDWPRIHAWAERNSGGQDPDIAAVDAKEAMSATVEMALYAIELAGRRRAEPADDLVSYLLDCEVDGHTMTDVEFGSFFVQLVTAGNDTTRTLLSSGVAALLEHPDQLALIRNDRGAIPGAIEEILRWANPLHYFRRTATATTELGGHTIAAGDKVAMIYTSANRDDAVFSDPHVFDVRRDPNPHLSFGSGEHFCLGVHLARLEGRVFFEELLDQFTEIELVGAPRRQRSNLNNTLKSLPLRLVR